jgi:hypothetical protein
VIAASSLAAQLKVTFCAAMLLTSAWPPGLTRRHRPPRTLEKPPRGRPCRARAG